MISLSGPFSDMFSKQGLFLFSEDSSIHLQSSKTGLIASNQACVIAFKIRILNALSVGDDRRFFLTSAAKGLSPPGCLLKIIILNVIEEIKNEF